MGLMGEKNLITPLDLLTNRVIKFNFYFKHLLKF